MTKTKMSTVAIVTLSVLLAAALAATIVLAAFSFNRSATTTITFAGGVTLQATGIDSTGAWKSNQVSSTGTVGDAISSTAAGAQTAGVALQAITLKNTGSQAVKCAVAVVITTSGLTMYVTDEGSTTLATGTVLKDSTNVSGVNFCGVSGNTTATATSASANSVESWQKFDIASGTTVDAVNILHTAFEAGVVDDFAGQSITAVVYVVAAYTDAGLTEAIASGSFTSFAASEVA